MQITLNINMIKTMFLIGLSEISYDYSVGKYPGVALSCRK